MHRRDFFKGLALVGAGVALGAELWTPTRTIFLPPRGGWYHGIRMREIQQYCISNDTFPVRYDMAWMKDGEYSQFYVEADAPIDPSHLEQNREVARHLFQDIIDRNGFHNAKRVVLALPRGCPHALYV